MKAEFGSPFKRFDSDYTRREIDEELRFHLELMTKENLRLEMSLDQAQDAARKRFGNIEQIKAQCAEISRRSNPLLRALKAFMMLVFLVGILVRVFSFEFHLTRVGDVLIAVGVLGRLLLYVRGLNPSSCLSKPETSSPLRLIDNSQPSINVYDQKKRTPVERVIFDR
jgi:hypothetical protein